MLSSYVLPKPLRYPLIAFYAYGAAVHVANMAGWTGFDWITAPQKWQVLDVVYLALDLGVVAGLSAKRWWGTLLLILAAGSQILLYTVLRTWVLDVPAALDVAPGDPTYLDRLVFFHVVSLGAIGLFLWRARITRTPA